MSLRRAGLPLSCLAAVLAYASPTKAATLLFNFDADPQAKTTPFTDRIGALSATFSGDASVCGSQNIFVSLTGNVLIQDLCEQGQSGPLSIAFSSDLAGVSFDFATASGAVEVTLSAFENGAPVGSSSFTSVLPNGKPNGEGVASFTGIFNAIELSSSNLLAIDNVNATVPEPATFALVFSAGVLFALNSRRRKLGRS